MQTIEVITKGVWASWIQATPICWHRDVVVNSYDRIRLRDPNWYSSWMVLFLHFTRQMKWQYLFILSLSFVGWKLNKLYSVKRNKVQGKSWFDSFKSRVWRRSRKLKNYYAFERVFQIKIVPLHRGYLKRTERPYITFGSTVFKTRESVRRKLHPCSLQW